MLEAASADLVSPSAPVGEALLWTLERGLGEHWTPDIAAAWTAAYTVLSDLMIGEANSIAAE